MNQVDCISLQPPFSNKPWVLGGAYMRSPATAVSTHGCKMEYDPLSKDGPSAVIEGGVLRALKCVENFLGQEKSTVPRYIEVKAGDAGLHQALTKWVN